MCFYPPEIGGIKATISLFFNKWFLSVIYVLLTAIDNSLTLSDKSGYMSTTVLIKSKTDLLVSVRVIEHELMPTISLHEAKNFNSTIMDSFIIDLSTDHTIGRSMFVMTKL